MIYIQIQQIFNLNRILLLAVGLWPYQQSKLVQLQLILLYGILISFIVFQFTVFLTTECTLDLVIKIFSTAFMLLIFITKYTAFWINIPCMRYLLEQLKHIFNELKNENEIAVMKKYSRNARRYTVAVILLTIGGLFIIIFLSMWPIFLNVLLSMNESRSRPEMQLMTEYFIDQDRYFYIILLHAVTAICIGLTAFIATSTMLVGYLTHACAMFSIASYRIEQAMKINMESISLKNEIMIYKKIIYAVDIHRKAMKFSTFLISNLEGWFMFVVMIVIVSTSLNLFGISRAVLHGDDIIELALPIICISILLMYTFVSNFLAQAIMDHNNHVFTTVYNMPWYQAPLHIQKIILFLLQRGTKAFSLNVGGLIVGSLESATTWISASISYFTVLYSLQQ